MPIANRINEVVTCYSRMRKLVNSVSGNISTSLFGGLFVTLFLSFFLERGGGCRVLMKKPEGKRTFRRLRRRWEDNIKMDFEEVE